MDLEISGGFFLLPSSQRFRGLQETRLAGQGLARGEDRTPPRPLQCPGPGHSAEPAESVSSCATPGPNTGAGAAPPPRAALAESCAPGKVLRWAAPWPAPLQASGCWPCVGEEDAGEEGSERGREPPPSHKQAGVGADAAGWERWLGPVSWARLLLPGAAGLSGEGRPAWSRVGHGQRQQPGVRGGPGISAEVDS